MKRAWAGALFIIACSTLHAQQPFTISGKLTDVKDAKIMLQYGSGKERKNDSVVIKNGKFSFKGTVTDPVKASITVKSLDDDGVFDMDKYFNRDTREFYIEGGKISINGATAATSKVEGGKTQADFNSLQAQLNPYQEQLKPYTLEIRKLLKTKDEEGIKPISEKMRPIRKEMDNVEAQFMKTHPASWVTWDMVKGRGVIIEPVTYEPLFNSVDQKFRDSEEGKKIAERIAITKKSAIGNKVMDFTQNNMGGAPVTLSSLKGKYVLVDFWASWCGPCRAENPNVLKAYQKFKDRNFEVLAVSLDDNKEKWAEAVEKDGMPWIQVSDLKGWKNDVAVQFGILAIPQNLLIDPNGTIIAKNLRGEALDRELEKFLK